LRPARRFAIVGIVVSAAVFIGETLTLDALSGAYAAGGVSRTASVVVAQGAIGFGAAVIFGFLVLIAGVGLYAFHTVKGRPYPRWLGYVGIAAAILFCIGAFAVSGGYVGVICWGSLPAG